MEFKIDGKPEILQCPQTLPPVFAGEKLVVYALVKAKSDKLKGKAVLKGKLLQKSISDTVAFKSAGAVELSPVSTVHHLAAKALIKDWERSGKDSKEIVKLSVESSVISSHTAFIAVDEENLKPIEGALQSFDVRARYSHSHPMMMRMGAPMMKGGPMLRRSAAPPGGGGGRGGVKKSKKASPRQSGPPPPPMSLSMAAESSSGPPPMVLSMACGPPPPPMASSMACGPPPPTMASRYMDVSSSSGPPPAQMMAPQIFNSADPNSSSNVVNNLSSIIGAQQADGSWKMNSTLALFVGKPLEEVESGCPTECQGVTALLWATVLILELLHSQYEDDLEEWELVGAKAEAWTKKQSISTTLPDMKAAAKKLLA